MADSTDTADPKNSASGAVTLTTGLSAGAAALFLLLRLLAVSRWDWGTAFGVVDVVGFGDAVAIVFGTLFAEPIYTGILLVWLLPATAVGVFWPVQRQRQRALSDVLLLAAFTACTASLALTYREWWLPAGVVTVAAVLCAVRLLSRHGRVHRALVLALQGVRVASVLSVLMLAAFVTVPWTPLEHIRTDGEALDGYVLEVESGYLRVLTEPDRRLEIIPQNTVQSRE